MHKHRGFPARLSGTNYHFILRRAGKKVTKLVVRERNRDRKPADCRTDLAFMAALWQCFGDQPFQRGNLDATRLLFLFGREVEAVDEPFDNPSYEAMLQINGKTAQKSYPEIFE